MDEESVQLVETTLRERKLSALWITHSDEQERRVATRTIHLGPREGGGNIHPRYPNVNVDLDGDAGSISGDSATGLRKKRSGVKQAKSQEQGIKRYQTQ